MAPTARPTGDEVTKPAAVVTSTDLCGATLVPLPRVAIRFCVQCKWNLRAAYVSTDY
jgi:Rdx family